MELRSLENNLLRVKPASDILTNKFEVTSNKNNIIFFFQFVYHAMEEFYDADNPRLLSSPLRHSYVLL